VKVYLRQTLNSSIKTIMVGVVSFLCTTAAASEKLQKGNFEIGLFQPLRYGLSEKIDISTHPVLMFFIPNLAVQKRHPSWAGLGLASRHSLVIPTPLLKMVTKKGVGGFISPEFDIPLMIALKNEIQLKRTLNDSWALSGTAGLTLAYCSKKLDKRTTIDLPVVFPRLGVFYNGYGINFMLGFTGALSPRLGLLTDLNVLLLPGMEEDFTFEHKNLLTWALSSRADIQIGYKLICGEYPFGVQWHLLPLLDVLWRW
jgi:hypothetical protein